MSRERQRMNPTRLCDAAEAAMKALAEFGETRGGPWPNPVDLYLSPHRPGCLDPYTRWEIEEATDFLARLGYLEPRRARGAA